MSTGTKIIGVLLFALATIIIYSWGLIKQRNQSKDLMNLLFSKGNSKVNKYLKKNEYITAAEVENMCAGLEANSHFPETEQLLKIKEISQKNC